MRLVTLSILCGAVLSLAAFFIWSAVKKSTYERVSDEVMINNAVAFYIEDTWQEEIGYFDGRTLKMKNFQSVDEFRDFLPDCCRMTENGANGRLVGLWDKLFTDIAGVVVISPKLRLIDEGEAVVLNASPYEVYMRPDGSVIPHLPAHD